MKFYSSASIYYCLIHAAVDCGLLEDPTNGRVAFTSTVFRSIATYSCFSGYDIVGVTQRVCTAEGVWSEVPPICQRMFLN